MHLSYTCRPPTRPGNPGKINLSWNVLEFLSCPGIYTLFRFCSGKSNKNTGSALTANVDSTSLITFDKNLRRIGEEEAAIPKLFDKLMLKLNKKYL